MHKLKGQTHPDSAAYKLFNKRFLINIQNKAFYTPFELEEIGFTSCGSVKDNETYLNEYRLVQTTLDKIAEWNYRGDSIRLTDLRDATDMFRIMDEHMNNWLKVTQAYPLTKLPPIEDFEALDKLCEMLYPLVDINLNKVEDPGLLLLFGNALSLGYLINNNDDEVKEPYKPYSPKLYGYTQYRWEK